MPLAIVTAAQPLAAQRPVCSDSTPFVGDTTGIGYRQPNARQLWVPPVDFPSKMKGTRARVRFLVNTAGVPDSIAIDGAIDAKYEKKFRQELARYRFSPASLGGCLRQGWYEVYIDF